MRLNPQVIAARPGWNRILLSQRPVFDPVVFASDLLPEPWVFPHKKQPHVSISVARTRQRTCAAIPDLAKFFTKRAILLVLIPLTSTHGRKQPRSLCPLGRHH
jgi:hypothetical protein